MGAISQALAQGSSFVYDGKTYSLAPWTFEIQGKFEKYLEAHAVDTYRKLSKLLPADEAEKALQALQRDITEGRYSFGSEGVARALESSTHTKYIFFLMLKKNHAEATMDLVEAMSRSMWRDMMDAINRANTPPKNEVAAEKNETTTSTAATES